MIALPIAPPPAADKMTPARRAAAESARRRAADRQAEYRRRGEIRFLRFQAIREAMHLNGMKIESYLGLQLLTLRPLNQWLNTPDELATLQFYAVDFPAPFIAAALENPDVAASMTPEDVRKNPPVRLRYEEASIFADYGSASNVAQSKSWGKLVAIEPIDPAFPFDGRRVQTLYHATSRYNRRFEQRRTLKDAIGKAHRRLIGDAMGKTKTAFLAKLTEADAAEIRNRLGIDAGEFWRAVKGAADFDPATVPGSQREFNFTD